MTLRSGIIIDLDSLWFPQCLLDIHPASAFTFIMYSQHNLTTAWSKVHAKVTAAKFQLQSPLGCSHHSAKQQRIKVGVLIQAELFVPQHRRRPS